MQYHFGYSLGNLYKLYEDKIVEFAKTNSVNDDIGSMFYSSTLQNMNKRLEITTTASIIWRMFQNSNLKSIKVKLAGHNGCYNMSKRKGI